MMFLFLIFGHALADYPLQGEFIALYKNPKKERDKSYIPSWYIIMAAHCMIHAGMVFLITGRWEWAVTEFAAHFVIDMMKCDGQFGADVDQALHILCKVPYALI